MSFESERLYDEPCGQCGSQVDENQESALLIADYCDDCDKPHPIVILHALICADDYLNAEHRARSKAKRAGALGNN